MGTLVLYRNIISTRKCLVTPPSHSHQDHTPTLQQGWKTTASEKFNAATSICLSCRFAYVTGLYIRLLRIQLFLSFLVLTSIYLLIVGVEVIVALDNTQ